MKNNLANSSSQISSIEYFESIDDFFDNSSNVAPPLVESIKTEYLKIKQLLLTTPAIANIIKASTPEQVFKPMWTQEQIEKLTSGKLRLMIKKDGSLMANLVNQKTSRVESTISFKEINASPALSQAIGSYAIQMQMAQISEQIQELNIKIDEIRAGQESDRLAKVYSCYQRLLQAMGIGDEKLKRDFLLRIANDADESRSQLMKSLDANLNFIDRQPKSTFQKLLHGATNEEIKKRMNEIRENINAIYRSALVEAIAYLQMGEYSTASIVIQQYASYINKSRLGDKKFIERLDSMESSPKISWARIATMVNEEIKLLPHSEN